MTLNHRKSPVPAGRIEVVMERTKILVVEDVYKRQELLSAIVFPSETDSSDSIPVSAEAPDPVFHVKIGRAHV